jgi:hypothetical protein
MGELMKRIEAAGPYSANPTSYEMVPGVRYERHDLMTQDLRQVGELSAEILRLDRAIGELTRIKLSCFRDGDFSGGDYWIPTLTTGRILNHRLDGDPESLAVLTATNPVRFTVTAEGQRFVLRLDGLETDALKLMDLLTSLRVDAAPADAGGESAESANGRHLVAWADEYADAVNVLVPFNVLDRIGGTRTRWIKAGKFALPFFHALRIAIRSAANSGAEGRALS